MGDKGGVYGQFPKKEVLGCPKCQAIVQLYLSSISFVLLICIKKFHYHSSEKISFSPPNDSHNLLDQLPRNHQIFQLILVSKTLACFGIFLCPIVFRNKSNVLTIHGKVPEYTAIAGGGAYDLLESPLQWFA